MVMRVWVLASCGSLLALSACSAEPTTTAQPSSLDSADDDLQTADRPSALDHTPGMAVDIDRALSRPELRPTRSQRAPIPSPARAQRTTLSPEQLRDRVERIRAQQIQPSRRVPIRPAAMAQAVTPPQVSQADGADVALRPGMVPTATLTITPLTPPPRPSLTPVPPGPSVVSDSPPPSATASVNTQTNLDNRVAVFLGEESTRATDLGSPESATLSRNFPLRSTAHQSDSALHSQDSVVISVAQPPASSDLNEGDQPEILGRGTDGGINTAHHSPWLTAEQTASQVDSQPLFAQVEAQPRTTTEATNLVPESEDTALQPPDALASKSAESPATEVIASPATETTEPLVTEVEEILEAEIAAPRSVVFPPSEPSADLSLSSPGLSAPVAGAESRHRSEVGAEVSVSAEPMTLDNPRVDDPNVHQSSDTAAAESPATVVTEFPAPEIAESPEPERAVPGPVVLPPSEPSVDLSRSAPGLSAPVQGVESAHWSEVGPEVSVAAVPMALAGLRFADPNVHQYSDGAAPTVEAGLVEPAVEGPHSEEWSSSEASPHCEPPTLAKPLPSDILADSAILEAKGIPGETAAEEIAVVDCP